MALDPVSSARDVVARRGPPYSEEAEKGVLGSILLDSARVMDMCVESQLAPESFYVPAHRIIYEALLDLQKHNAVIDVLTATDALRKADKLDAIGGAIVLDRLIDSTPTAAHAEYYIDIVRQKHLLRSIIECAREAETACYDSEASADQILGITEQSFLNITERQHGFASSWHDAVNATMEHVEKMFNGTAPLGGVSTGYANLDKKCLGLRPSEMIVLAARPSMGKTSLAMNVAENIALGVGGDRVPRAVGIFSLEMSQEALVMRMLCSRAGVSGFDLAQGFVRKQDHGHLTQAASVLRRAPIFLDDTGGLDVMELRARARRMKKKHDVQMIMIDYLQLLSAREFARQGRQIETSQISGNLKAMAKELKVPVLVLSQLSRAPEQRDKSGKPKLSDLRDSGAIEQDADVVWMLRRPCRYPGDDEYEDETLAIVDVAKHRNGPTGEVRLNFEEKLTRFRDRVEHGVDGADDYGPDYEDAEGELDEANA